MKHTNRETAARCVAVAFAGVLILGSTGCVTYKSVTMTPTGDVYVPYEKSFLGMSSSGILLCKRAGEILRCADLEITEERSAEHPAAESPATESWEAERLDGHFLTIGGKLYPASDASPVLGQWIGRRVRVVLKEGVSRTGKLKVVRTHEIVVDPRGLVAEETLSLGDITRIQLVD